MSATLVAVKAMWSTVPVPLRVLEIAVPQISLEAFGVRWIDADDVDDAVRARARRTTIEPHAGEIEGGPEADFEAHDFGVEPPRRLDVERAYGVMVEFTDRHGSSFCG